MPQPQDLFIPVAVQTTTIEERGVTLKELSILAATPAQPGVLAIVLASKDEYGNFRNDGVLLRKTDNPESDDPREKFAASAFHELMLSAVVTDTPAHRALGVVGLTVFDAGKVIAGKELLG